MKTKIVGLAVLAAAASACVHVPRVAPAMRTEAERSLTTVRIESSCGGFVDDGEHVGTGVIISERHVLTAAHVVACSAIPVVHVTYRRDGEIKRQRMVVTREDTDRDVARLEIASADRFRVNVAPPVVRAPDPGERVCAELPRLMGIDAACGSIVSDWTVARTMKTRPGDSGAPIFDATGTLVGLVSASGVSTANRPYTRIALIDDSWTSDLVPEVPADPSPWRLERPPLTANR